MEREREMKKKLRKGIEERPAGGGERERGMPFT